MTAEAIAALVFVCLFFAVFMTVLFWADRQTREFRG